MSSSLTDACTPLKTKYDSCFNAWFEGYLEPVVKATSDESRKALQKAKAEEYERNCGAMWTDYRDCCIQRAVADKGLTQLLEDARRENPMQNPPSPPNKS
ncbi:hypothetical protein EXIGLDRAFT_623208 [Exidia glandulosa HHB12029]|uniref:Uncharacterized protein n=1 Tax=Exidia glandulosa HHB12029 TaxID=1314781 RepID=A0A165DTK7_EXIGL|nr:hypothetical protein EXIGLDRAFT_623208 [Exidia glandulosa HHB12029]